MLSLIITFIKSIVGETDVEEVALDHHSYIPKIYNDHIELSNVQVNSEKLVMRSSIDSGSMIRWDIPNEHEDFSFEVVFNEPNLSANELASLYLFYTKERPVIGNLKGGFGKFNGFMAGIEMKGKSVELGYALNEGKDYTNLQGVAILTDAISPTRFKNVEELRMKIIFTKKNIKFELYNGDKLLYDNFRIYDEKELDFIKKGYYFGLFADYKDASSGKAIEIRKVQAYKRVENAKYDPLKKNIIPISNKIAKSEILHSNTDAKHFINSVYNVIHLIEKLFGKLPNGTLKKIDEELGKELEIIESKLKNLYESQNNIKDRKPTRLNEIDNKIQMINRQMIAVEFSLENLREKKRISEGTISNIILVIGVLSMIILLKKEVHSFMENRKL